MFDRVEIMVKPGNGGDGAVTFRHEKFVPLGGPDGGDGGNGGNVVIMADPNVTSLGMFRQNRVYKAGNGGNGTGKKRHGRNGEDLILGVPPGTIVLDRMSHGAGASVADLKEPGESVVVASGGRGGWGNTHYVSSTNQAPRIAQKGETGEERSVILEMRLIADVGIIGYPNVGKSTLLAAASAAKPKIAGYPFTTLEPVLGVVETGHRSFVLAEIPGLIEGAHAGRGLGHDFLRHAMRTRVFIHLIDGASDSPVQDMLLVNRELSEYDVALARKPQLVVVNKVDLPEVQARVEEIEHAFSEAVTSVLFVSAATGEGVSKLIAEATRMLVKAAAPAEVIEKVALPVFRPKPRGRDLSVLREGDTFIVRAPELERIVARVDMTDPEVRRQFQRQLAKMGVSKALEKAGAKPGDKIRCGSAEWEW